MTQDVIQNAMLQELSKAFIQAPFNQLIGIQLDYLDARQVVMRFNMKQELIGNYLRGILHGGVISSVLDVVGGLLVMAAVVYNQPEQDREKLIELVGKCSTVDLHISFLRPGIGDEFIAKAWLLKSGKKVSFTRMELINQKESLIATGLGTYLLK